MTGFEDTADAPDGEYAWLETYFVLIKQDQRPTLTQVEGTLDKAGAGRWRIDNLRADDDGYFESLLVRAPEDHAALEVRYEAGQAVEEQAVELAGNLRGDLDDVTLARMVRSDARLDILHLERLEAGAKPAADPRFEDASDADPFASDAVDDEPSEADFAGEGLDPGSLLMVVEALASLTGGLPFDPAAGEVLL